MKYIDLIYVYVSSNRMYPTSLYFGAQNHNHDYTQYQDQNETKKTRQDKAKVEVYVRKKGKRKSVAWSGECVSMFVCVCEYVLKLTTVVKGETGPILTQHARS